MLLKYFIWGGPKQVQRWYSRYNGSIVAAPVTEWCKTETDRNKYLQDLFQLDKVLNNQEIAVKASGFDFNYKRILPLIIESTNIWSFDAEESWTKGKYHTMMKHLIVDHGSKVRKCYQGYLKNELSRLIHDTEEYGDQYCIRLVRGAYHELECKKATDAVFERKEETDYQFRQMMEYLVKEVNNPVMICTHNSNDIYWLLRYMEDQIAEKENRVQLGQLLGMGVDQSDTIVKYVPYGTLQEALPYLMRRLYENKSMYQHIFSSVFVPKSSQSF